MAAAGRVAIGALIGAAAAALFIEGVQAGARFSAVPDGPPRLEVSDPSPAAEPTAAPGTLISATSAAAPTSSTTTTTATTTTSATTTTTTAAPVTTTTTREPRPDPTTTTTVRPTTTTNTTTRRPCGILWCP